MSGLMRDFNPFANVDLHVPKAYRDALSRYTTSQGGKGDTSPDTTPFHRYVDMWFMALAVGAEKSLYISEFDRHRFMTGAVLQGDIARIEFLQMVAIRHEDDPFVVSKPRQVVDIADGYAAGGMPVVIDWLEDHSRTPLMSLTRNVTQFLDATTSS